MNTLKEILNVFIGSYEPITYVNAEGISVIPEGLAGVDFGWIAGALIVILGVYSIFRVIGIVISKF